MVILAWAAIIAGIAIVSGLWMWIDGRERARQKTKERITRGMGPVTYPTPMKHRALEAANRKPK